MGFLSKILGIESEGRSLKISSKYVNGKYLHWVKNNGFSEEEINFYKNLNEEAMENLNMGEYHLKMKTK